MQRNTRLCLLFFLLASIHTVSIAQETVSDSTPIYGMKWVSHKTYPQKKYHVYDADDHQAVYKKDVNSNHCFFVVSKREFRLYVYEVVGTDTVLVAHYPICYAKNTGDKHKTGDGTTPVCAKDKNGDYLPFCICQIQPSNTWRHDFKDGRGNILAYGNWFMRLKLNNHPYVSSNRSIGIHGSTGNELSVPGRDSEGCIRLRDDDLNHLRQFARVGTPVIVKSEDDVKMPFEIRAQKQLGVTYRAARRGYQLPR